jgi:hypothetical protein
MIQGYRWAHKPIAGTPVDRGHPLAAGLVAFMPLNDGGGGTAVDAIGRSACAMNGGATWGPGYQGGPAVVMTTSDAQVVLPLAGKQLVQVPFTVATRFLWTGNSLTSSNMHTFAVISATGTLAARMRWNNAPSIWVAGGPGSYSGLTGSVFAAKTWYTMVLACTASGSTMYEVSPTGALLTYSDAIANGAITYGSGASLTLGWNSNSSAGIPYALYDWGGLWSRALSADEAVALANNPWQMMRPMVDYASIIGAQSAGIRLRRTLYARVGSRGVT